MFVYIRLLGAELSVPPDGGAFNFKINTTIPTQNAKKKKRRRSKEDVIFFVVKHKGGKEKGTKTQTRKK